MSEPELDAALTRELAHPANIRQADEFWAIPEQTLAEIGLADWLAKLDEGHPNND